MSDSTYFLFYGDKKRLFPRRKELDEMVNTIFKDGVSLGDMWVIKGRRLQVNIKELIVGEK